ncbi:MAG: hypothetical protein RIT27_1621 [Pseudomonadota bacterium]|jgi:nickel transport protein
MKRFLILLIFITTKTFAHGLYLFADVQQNRIEGRAYYADQTPIENEQVILYDQNNLVLQKSLTNAQGRFHFNIEKPQTYKIVVQAEEGHRAETVVIFPQSKTNSLEQQLQQALENKFQIQPNYSANNNEKNLDNIITTVLQRELQPLKEKIDQYERTIRWHDIIGGLGYLFGLSGFLFFLKTRKP